eukprot:6276193-Pyramimonas_sp.AAC.1
MLLVSAFNSGCRGAAGLVMTGRFAEIRRVRLSHSEVTKYSLSGGMLVGVDFLNISRGRKLYESSGGNQGWRFTAGAQLDVTKWRVSLCSP